MARRIAEIKQEITDAFMLDETLQSHYGFTADDVFDVVFSKFSIENIVIYIVSSAIWTLETLFDYHKTEVYGIMAELKPHTPKWYAEKVKGFMLGRELVEDADYYDTSGMTDAEIEQARVVKYSAVVEKSGVVYIKIATDDGGEPAPVSPEVLEGIKSYMKECKDAGVVIEFVNEPAEHFRLQLTVYYNPMVMTGTGHTHSGATPVQDTIKRFIRELPFNGEYRNVSLVDALQQIEGVVIPELRSAETSRDGAAWEAVNAKAIPYSGYYKIYSEDDLRIEFVPYETVSD